MAKRQGDVAMGYRMAEELSRLFPTQAMAAERLGFERKSVFFWSCGTTPSALALAKLHYCGGDVIYVLTGKRSVDYGEK